jgi:two-component system, cell cycle sensor histidine kinase and response regulator CckA
MQSDWQSLRGSETVLLVDDEDSLRDVVVNVLTDLGYRVLAATNGREAITLADTYSGVIDLVVADVVMPEMTGPEVAEKILQSRPGVQVIFVSGFPKGKLEKFSEHHADTILVEKPFTIKTLTMKMREVLDA